MPDGVTSALIAAASAIAVLFLGNMLTAYREGKAKRLQLAIEHAEKQISEFYSPLAELVVELDAYAGVEPAVDPTLPEGEQDGVKRKLSDNLYAEFFSPTHEKIVAILRDKMHLVEGWEIPQSFTTFLRHYTGQKVEAALKNKGLNAIVKVPGYPGQFYHDVRNGLVVVSKRYEGYLQEARQGIETAPSPESKDG